MQYDLFGDVIIPEGIKNLRIPYMGSKNKIAIDLLREMLKVKPKAKYFYDLFGGGGSMSFTASQIGLKTHYNELQTSLVNFIDYIFNRIKKGLKGQYGLFPDDFYNFIDREEFMKLKEEDSIKGQFARICYSFGNNQRTYLFGDIEETKHLAHNVVMFKCEKSLKELNNLLDTDIKTSNLPTWNGRRLDFVKGVKINTPIEETIIYLDPPYRNTEKYIEGKDFDYKELDQWFLENKYTCFMSEYNAPHKVIFEIDKLSLLNNSEEKKKVVKEKLFWNNN